MAKRDPSKPITEAQFQRRVVALAKQAGWMVAHVERAQRRPGQWTTPTTAGWPDLALMRGTELVFLELKRQGGTMTEAQARWVSGLQRVETVEAFCVQPSDEDEILALLARPRPNPPDTIPATLTEPTKETTA